jgi:nucleotide-binding universal stress UspA family protein
MKLIMLPVADRPECKLALDAAFLLARQFAGSVMGCHLRPHRSERPRENLMQSYFGFSKSAAVSSGLSEKEIELKSKDAEKLFKRLAAEYEFKQVKQPTLGAERVAEWHEMVGSLDRLFSIIGPTTDVSIVSRPKKTAAGPGAEFLLAALLDTGKPVIVLPQAPITSLGKRVVIAWNQSIEAARAVTAAMPILQQAEAVEIVSSGAESRTGPKAAALVNYLKYWNVKASRTRTKGRDAATEILDTVRRTESDLIVMGAYSRGRFRQKVFGGVTEDILFRSGEPVFSLHS